MTTPPDLPLPATPPTDVPAGPSPEIRPYTGIEDRPGQSTPEVEPAGPGLDEPELPGGPRVPPAPDREIEPPRH